MKVLPVRKQNRLQNYDYSQCGAYFVTICAKNHFELFGTIDVGANCVRPQLSQTGEIVEAETKNISSIYQFVCVDCFVIMPNHVHMIIVIEQPNDKNRQMVKDGRTQFAPTISRVIKQWKGAITKKVGFPVWQKSFHDHIIRNETDYIRIAKYIENNPATWKDDCHYLPITN